MSRELDAMREARERPAVQRHKLILLRQDYPQGLIFVFEGDEDKQVYAQWIGRIDEDVSYEPLPLKGKRQVLSLYQSIKSHQDRLATDVYFFIDRDFDDTQGVAVDATVFVTEFHPIENYLVTPSVVDRTLRDDLHLHGRPYLRAAFVDQYLQLREQFCRVTSEVNLRIFSARMLDRATKRLPSKISHIAVVTLTEVTPAPLAPQETVIYVDDVAEEEIEGCRPAFSQLDMPQRFRGKYLLMFMQRWLDLCATERVSRSTDLFQDAESVQTVARDFFSLAVLASRSAIPEKLPEFIRSAA